MRVAARAIDGKANAELLRFLAHTLRLRTGEVSIVKGTRSRHKVIELPGIPDGDVHVRLGVAPDKTA